MRKLRDELQGKLATEQQAVAKSQQEIKAFQDRQGQSAAELERARTALKEKEVRCNQLEKELVGLQQTRDELQNKFATGQKTAEKLQQELNAEPAVAKMCSASERRLSMCRKVASRPRS